MQPPRWIPLAQLGGIVGLGLLLVVAILVLTDVQAGGMHYVGMVVPYVALALIAFGGVSLLARSDR